MANELITQHQAILAQYGISEANVKEAEIAPVASAQDFGSLMLDVEGDGIELKEVGHFKCEGVTPPLLLLALAFHKSEKFKDSYAGFYTVTCLGATDGRQHVVTVSRPLDDTQNGLGNDLEQMVPGNIFRVAQIPTSRGFRVYRCIPLS
jgi:hypothetical protein